MAIYLTTQNFMDQNLCINLPISFIHVLFLKDPQKELIGKNTELINSRQKVSRL